jgi:hypothetical protein
MTVQVPDVEGGKVSDGRKVNQANGECDEQQRAESREDGHVCDVRSKDNVEDGAGDTKGARKRTDRPYPDTSVHGPVR